jgi:hypothetical protein
MVIELFLINLCRVVKQAVDPLPVKVSDGYDMSRCHPSTVSMITFCVPALIIYLSSCTATIDMWRQHLSMTIIGYKE